MVVGLFKSPNGNPNEIWLARAPRAIKREKERVIMGS